jgi:AGZA family xanthine/uracil permease-like MFS transporter
VRTEIIAGLTTFLSMAGVLAIIMMPFTFSIANGIMFGILSYVILKVSEGRIREIKPVMWVSAAMFALYIVLG